MTPERAPEPVEWKAYELHVAHRPPLCRVRFDGPLGISICRGWHAGLEHEWEEQIPAASATIMQGEAIARTREATIEECVRVIREYSEGWILEVLEARIRALGG